MTEEAKRVIVRFKPGEFVKTIEPCRRCIKRIYELQRATFNLKRQRWFITMECAECGLRKTHQIDDDDVKDGDIFKSIVEKFYSEEK